MAGHEGGASGLTDTQVNDLIHEYGIWELEASFTSFDQQDAVEDVINPVDFGDSKISPSGLIEYDDTLKDFTVLKSGAYLVKSRYRAARIGASAGVSDLFVQAQVSVDGRASWLPTADSVDVRLDNTAQVEIFFDFSPVFFPAGAIVRQVFARSSTGTDFGSLIAGVPSAALTAAGITDAPAAQVSIYKLRDYNYV